VLIGFRRVARVRPAARKRLRTRSPRGCSQRVPGTYFAVTARPLSGVL